MKLTSRGGSKLDMQMTSMIDVVFLLLIFFMVTSSFQKTERELDPAIKVERRAAAAAAQDLAPTIVEIKRGAGGDFVFQLGGRELTSPAELTQVLAQFDNKERAFVRAVDVAPYAMAAQAIQACKDARFFTVSYVPQDE
jgi:biopolymer transport protein ExbD